MTKEIIQKDTSNLEENMFAYATGSGAQHKISVRKEL